MNNANVSLCYYEIVTFTYVAKFIFIVAPIVMFTMRAFSTYEGEAGQVRLVLSNPSSTAITIEVLTQDLDAIGN